MSKKIVVMGSSNVDMVVKTKELPAPGQTVLGKNFQMLGGGKGANQAIAAARLGGDVSFIARIGNDVFGDNMMETFRQQNIDTKFIFRDPEQPSGVALITVDNCGENTIAVAPGANACLSAADMVSASDLLLSASILMLQLEVPLSTVEKAVDIVSGKNCRVILNPAPARAIPGSILRNVFLLTPNKKEAEMLSGMSIRTAADYLNAAACLNQLGAQNVIITAGADGAFVFSAGFTGLIPGYKTTPVDTTGAGDVFNGALAFALVKDCSIKDSVILANKAAAISVTRTGAQVSAPYINELKHLY